MELSRSHHNRTLVTAVVLLCSALGLSWETAAQDEHKHEGVPGQWMQVEAMGTNYCIGCALKSEFGAASQCSIYGHKNGLKVQKLLEPSGMELAEWNGKTVFYLENDRSKELINGHAGETLSISGKLYLDTHLLEVTSFKAGGTTDK